MIGHPRQQRFQSFVRTGQVAAAGLGFGHRDHDPRVVGMLVQQRHQFFRCECVIAVALVRDRQTIALGIVQWLGFALAYVLFDRRACGVRTEHPDAFSRPAELHVVVHARRPCDAQAEGNQRIFAGDGAAGIERRRLGRQFVGALFGFADAGGVDRMGTQVVRRAFALAALIHPRDGLHAGEHARHRVRIVLTACEGLDTETVGFGFVRAGVVDLALRHQRLRRCQRGHRGVIGRVASRRLCDRDRAQHRQQDRHAVLLRAFDAAQHVGLGDVGDFVRQHAGDFVLGFGRQHQAGIGPDVTTERGEGIELPVFQHEERERVLRFVAGGRKAMAHRLQPAVDQRIVQHVAVMPQLAEHHVAVFGLPGRVEQLVGRRADIRQPVVLRRNADRRKGEGEGGDHERQTHGGIPETMVVAQHAAYVRRRRECVVNLSALPRWTAIEAVRFAHRIVSRCGWKTPDAALIMIT